MTPRPNVVLVGTLDTKSREYAFVRDRLVEAGVAVTVVDIGILGEPGFRPDIPAAEVARAADVDLASLRSGTESNDARSHALTTMERGAATVVGGLLAADRCDGVMGLGGSGGSTVISGILRALPLGLPKVLVSTMASGNTRPFVGTSDICLIYPVTDIQGLNRVSRVVLTNAANAMAGMALGHRREAIVGEKPLIALTMMGVTTPAVQGVQAALDAAGFETIVFHATGSGGRAMEDMISAGRIDGVVDVTTAEVTAERYGGILSAGPDRLLAAGRRGIPMVVAPGALEVLNFGARETIPPEWQSPGHRFVQHNPSITSVRLNAREAAAAGALFAEKVSAATGPAAVVLPLGGCTKYELPGGPFVDPAADAALFEAIRANLRPGIVVREVRANLNEPAFVACAVETFLSLWALAQRGDARRPRGDARVDAHEAGR